MSTFKIEAEFGFNRTTAGKFVSDLFKQWALMLALGLPLIWAIVWIMNAYFEQAWWLYTWLVWMAFQLLIMWAYPQWIAPIFNKFTPLEDEAMKTRIQNLLARTGFESNGIYVMDGSSRSGHGNAYFTGFGKTSASSSSIPCWKNSRRTRLKRYWPTNSVISNTAISNSA
jgi:Peptidase family M48.